VIIARHVNIVEEKGNLIRFKYQDGVYGNGCKDRNEGNDTVETVSVNSVVSRK